MCELVHELMPHQFSIVISLWKITAASSACVECTSMELSRIAVLNLFQDIDKYKKPTKEGEKGYYYASWNVLFCRRIKYRVIDYNAGFL